jgi:predicted membrane-bound spermidine synthase
MNEKKLNIYSYFWLLLLAGFISGGAVMAVELLSAKIIAAWYGNSLYVWSAVLAITLGGLATGYFLGGYLSLKNNRRFILLAALIAVSLLVFLMPVISSMIMESTLKISLKTGIVISCLVFVFPPLLCFGLVSPLIIGVIEQRINEPGKVSGIVYSISTVGGILFTFLTGYFFIPYCGLKQTSYIMGISLTVSFFLAFAGSKNKIR